MKLITFITSLALFWVAANSQAQVVIPGADGSDGALVITSNTVINLANAVTANWDADSPIAGTGVYDSNQWAVVFKYSSVVICSNATLTFSNHPSRAPLVWLVSGDVTINGALVVDGQGYQPSPTLPEPGPGGFRGGCGYYAAGVTNGAGFGPGGGTIWYGIGGYTGGGGSYGTLGYAGSSVYGNPSLIPLIGGSGAGGGTDGGILTYGYGSSVALSGAAGGGAILIACSGTLTDGGTISANGGQGVSSSGNFGPSGIGDGSGGGIRLVAQTLAGNGIIQALGGGTVIAHGNDALYGGLGRIRIERVVNTNSISVTPDPSVVDLSPGSTAMIWPPDNAPTVTVVSVGSANAPADPRAGFGTIGADVVQPLASSVPVVIETTNVEQASQVLVIGTPRSTGPSTTVNAALSTVINTSPMTLLWTANLPVNVGYSAIQVQVIRP